MQNEFNKPFEYFEEKGVGGILLVLFFMLIALEPLLGIMAAYIWTDAVKNSGLFTTVIICAAVLFILFAFFGGIALKKAKPFAIPTIKFFLAYRVLFLAPVIYIIMKYQVAQIPVFNKEYIEYQTAYRSVMSSFTVSMAYVILFSAGWYTYLIKSKKVAEYFPKKTSDIQKGA